MKETQENPEVFRLVGLKDVFPASKILSNWDTTWGQRPKWQPGHHVFVMTSDWLCSPFRFFHFHTYFRLKGLKCARSVMSDFCNPMDCSWPGSYVPGIFPARILEWVTISTSRESSWPRIKLTSPVPPALQVDSAQIFGHHSPDKLTHQINHCNYSLTMCFSSSLSNWECLLYWSVCVCVWVSVCVCVCRWWGINNLSFSS